MAIRQFSVFLENVPGSLARFTALLRDEGIDLLSISMADTTHFGILRGIATDNDRAHEVLEKQGYTVKMTDVLAVSVPDEPGSLAHMLQLLAEGGISVEYLYSTMHSSDGRATIILRVDDCARAEQILSLAGVKLPGEAEFRQK